MWDWTRIEPRISPFDLADANQPRLFLIVFCSYLALVVSWNFREQTRYFRTRPSRIYGQPPLLLGRFQLPALTSKQFQILGVAFITSLLLAASGVFTRLFLLAAIVCYFPYFNSIMSMASIQRKSNLLPIVLLILFASPSVGASLWAPGPVWPILLIKLALTQMYFSAGVQKLRNSGLKWLTGESLRAYLVKHYLWGDTKRALQMADRPGICRILSILILVFELTFFLILTSHSLSLIYCLVGIVFHLGISATMRINYLKYVGPVYAVFLIDLFAAGQKYLAS